MLKVVCIQKCITKGSRKMYEVEHVREHMYLGTSNLSRWMHSGYVHVHVHVHVLYNLPLCTYIHVVIRYVYVTSTVQVPVLS